MLRSSVRISSPLRATPGPTLPQGVGAGLSLRVRACWREERHRSADQHHLRHFARLSVAGAHWSMARMAPATMSRSITSGATPLDAAAHTAPAPDASLVVRRVHAWKRGLQKWATILWYSCGGTSRAGRSLGLARLGFSGRNSVCVAVHLDLRNREFAPMRGQLLWSMHCLALWEASIFVFCAGKVNEYELAFNIILEST